MKGWATFALAGVIAAQQAAADGYVIGAGRWTCERALSASVGRALDKGQVYGWIFGAISQQTFAGDTKFVDTIEQIGGARVAEIVFDECRKAAPDTELYKVVDKVVRALR